MVDDDDYETVKLVSHEIIFYSNLAEVVSTDTHFKFSKISENFPIS